MARRPEIALVRPHVITSGRARPTRASLDVITLLQATTGHMTGSNPEHQRIYQLCCDQPLSVADIAAELALPVSVTKVLVADLIDGGHLTIHSAVAERPDVELLQQVLDRLARL